MEELKLPLNEEEEAKARETMEQMRKAASAQLSAQIESIPKEMLSDQWKRGGICAMCRRRDYCKTQCRANRIYAAARLREYIRRRTGADQVQAALMEQAGIEPEKS